MRFLPLGRKLSPVEELLRERGHGDQAVAGNWEFGRLVLDPRYRSGAELLERCVFLAVSHLAHHHDCGYAFASCTPALSRLYRRFGFSVVSNDVRVPGEEKPYHLIRAAISDVLEAAASTDTERALAHTLTVTA
jgi:hypothetical protein